MGTQNVSDRIEEKSRLAFTRALLDDLSALEQLIEGGQIETGVRRIGAEQEIFLVDRSFQPACLVEAVLARLDDPRFTTELAQFNLEINLTPALFGGRCLRALEEELEQLLATVRRVAHDLGADLVLSGILPTVRAPHLKLEHMTPRPRYHELNRGLIEMRGGDFQVLIQGLDELRMSHDNVMLEACNTSFQVHLQVGPDEFAACYNMAQAVTGPVLAAAVNSPMLLGRRLWSETRVALFGSAVDERTDSRTLRGQPARVSFGDGWVHDSVLELFREDISRHRVLLVTRLEEPSTTVVARGEVPALRALSLHNGTVWRWNRPCYGVTAGRPHLRIENRVLPAGPTVLDEVANAAFYLGLLLAGLEAYGDIRRLLSFDQARDNFLAAAHHGLQAQIAWVGGRTWPADRLILAELLPLAARGLEQAGIEAQDRERYLEVLEARVRTGQTGARWMLDSIAAMDPDSPPDARHRALTAAMLEHQLEGIPVSRWPLARLEDAAAEEGYQTVGQFMSTDLFTVRPDDLVDLAASVMEWRHVKYVPVEDREGHLVGLVSHRELLRHLAGCARGEGEPVPVRSIMVPDPVSISPDTPALEALEVLRRAKVSCLPVVEEGRLVGIVTAHDFLAMAERVLERRRG